MSTRASLRKLIRHDIQVYTGFRLHLMVYVIVMLTIWGGWLAQGGALDIYAWPVYPTFAWGFILIIHCLAAYRSFQARKNTNMRY